MKKIILVIVLLSFGCKSESNKSTQIINESVIEFDGDIKDVTHLKDTIQISGKTILILRPDSLRFQYYLDTGKKWISPSPNISDNKTAFIYQGTCLIEGTNLSEGRGTEKPFIYIGAPWLNSSKILEELKKIKLEGVDFYIQKFTPKPILGKIVSPKFEYQNCNGIGINITNRREASPLLITVHIINIIIKFFCYFFLYHKYHF